jgi:hypothetical protein
MDKVEFEHSEPIRRTYGVRPAEFADFVTQADSEEA